MQTAHIIGNLGQDPEMKYSANGVPLLRFSVACNERRRQQNGDYEEETEWYRVTISGQRAESLSQYLHKGQKIFAAGRLSARPWISEKDDVLHAGMEIFADRIEFMGTREQDDQQQQRSGNRGGGNQGYGNRGGGGGNYGGNGGGGYARQNNGGGQQRSAPQQQRGNGYGNQGGGNQGYGQPVNQQEQQAGFGDGDLEDLPF